MTPSLSWQQHEGTTSVTDSSSRPGDLTCTERTRGAAEERGGDQEGWARDGPAGEDPAPGGVLSETTSAAVVGVGRNQPPRLAPKQHLTHRSQHPQDDTSDTEASLVAGAPHDVGT